MKPGLPLIEFHHPTTFAGRGVAAPFTTPLLAGARVRRSPRGGVELVAHNPSGNRGVYIVEGTGLRALCNPTMHDRMLIERATKLADVTPAGIRTAALAVALEGYAGPAAAMAAAAVSDRDIAQHLLAHFLLLAELIEQVEPTGRQSLLLADRTPDFDRQAGTVLRRLAAAWGCPAALLSDGMAALGGAFAPFGVAPDDGAARLPRLLARLRDTERTLGHWTAIDKANDIGGLGSSVAAAIQATGHCAQTLLSDTRAALANPAALLKGWLANASETIATTARCDWLLDGWEQICLLWQTAASDLARRSALLEMAHDLPILPTEVTGWAGLSVARDAMDPTCRVTSRNDSWRRGKAAAALIRRNERMRAMSL